MAQPETVQRHSSATYRNVTAPNGKHGALHGTTDANGKTRVSLVTSLHGTFTFCVTDVTKTGYTYDPTQNVEACDRIIVP